KFLQVSQQTAARSARRRRSGIALLALVTVAAMIASAFAFQQRSRELQQRNQAIYNEITAEAAQVATTNPSLAAQLTLAAYHLDPTQGLASQLISTENTPLSIPLTTSSADSIGSVAFSPDGRIMASGNIGGAIRLWDVTIPARPRTLAHVQVGGSVNSLTFSPDGRALAVAGSPNSSGTGAIWLWNVTSPADPRMLGEPLSPN